ncbi:Ubiquitin-like protein pmt3/smt3 [Neolecta irregularis DAH-3]|uniref:Ubiquitin-like protein pmt3/smt3 n=1 Tax=Neolecta irregularis (strain DAH-3) TaxID=1198029 RepID=A0A1U7LSF2_NEOID|nr:Ubiquitin-like protein pmt3/smt3 [Neolecta irregularis DAH-3]|eukprot:OLL25600.1 Ubiquitin-like protein pmt3/smt3 [Neolecta irregularis DAH-3]
MSPSPSAEERKPASDNQSINLRVVDANHQEVAFKIKRHTPMKKLMNAYCQKQGKALDSVRFIADGTRINPEDTPDSLELEEDDMIQVEVMQIGGSTMKSLK